MAAFEGLAFDRVRVDGDPAEFHQGVVSVIGEETSGEHFEWPVVDVGVAGQVAVLIGEGADESYFFWGDDFAEGPLAPHLDAVGGAKAVMKLAAGAEGEPVDGDGEFFWPEPLLEGFFCGPGGKEFFARGV